MEPSAFRRDIVDGKIWGRGSDDAKSLASTGVLALTLLKRRCTVGRGTALPRRRRRRGGRPLRHRLAGA
ncbi:MAG: hypothetical protein R2873_00505 [Caldilineaceae bacterium]